MWQYHFLGSFSMFTCDGSMRHFLHLSHCAQFTLSGPSSPVARELFLELLPSRLRLRLFFEAVDTGVVARAGTRELESSFGASQLARSLSHWFMEQNLCTAVGARKRHVSGAARADGGRCTIHHRMHFTHHFSGSWLVSTVPGRLRHLWHLSHITQLTLGLVCFTCVAGLSSRSRGLGCGAPMMGTGVPRSL